MDWSDIDTWPMSDVSRRIDGPVHRWHAQVAGKEGADIVLLLHGAGGSTHSFRDMIPLLRAQYQVIALDLPGHGFTQLGARQRSGLAHMARDVAALCQQEGWAPRAIVGHSAGAAVALQMANDARAQGQEAPPHVIGLNAALGEFPGLAGLLFPLMAKALAAMPFATTLFSSTSANPSRVRSLISSTGSTLDADGHALYRRLVADKAHVDGTLRMMALWDLKPLLRSLPDYAGPVDLIASTNDATVPAAVSKRVAAQMPQATLHMLDGYGHLVHEEAPQEVAALIVSLLEAGKKNAAPTSSKRRP